MNGPYLSQSIAKILLAKSPRHAWHEHPQLNPDYRSYEKEGFDLGTAAHDLILEGGTPKIVFVNPEEYKTKSSGNTPTGWNNNEIKARRDEIRANRQIPVLLKYKSDIEAMRDAAIKAIAECKDLSGLMLADGKSEQEISVPYAGIILRGRLDWLADDYPVIWDYKSTTDAEPGAFSRQIARMGYHIQDAFYRLLMKIKTGQAHKFIFIAQENDPPFDCSFHGVDPSLAEIADAEVERAIRIWAECIKRNEWPGYSKQIHWTVATNWQMAEYEQRLLEAA